MLHIELLFILLHIKYVACASCHHFLVQLLCGEAVLTWYGVRGEGKVERLGHGAGYGVWGCYWGTACVQCTYITGSSSNWMDGVNTASKETFINTSSNNAQIFIIEICPNSKSNLKFPVGIAPRRPVS